jgi:hypothetical protein
MAAMITALIFLPIFVGLSAALTVIVANLLSPETSQSSSAAKKPDGKRAAAA